MAEVPDFGAVADRGAGVNVGGFVDEVVLGQGCER